MSRVLVLYGTTDGHTAKVASALARYLNQIGCFADAVDASGSRRSVPARHYAGVIVAASIHAGGFQRPVRRWVRANVAELARRPGAFVSVCLGVLQRKPEVDRELQRIIANFLAPLGWRPDTVKLVAGALPYTRYSWLKKWIMRRIAAKTGGGTDTSRDYEYTDWDDLRDFAAQFVRDHGLMPARGTERVAAASAGA